MSERKNYERILERLKKQNERKDRLQEQLRDVRNAIKDLETERDAIKGRLIVQKLQAKDITSIEELNEFLDETSDFEASESEENHDDYNLGDESNEY